MWAGSGCSSQEEGVAGGSGCCAICRRPTAWLVAVPGWKQRAHPNMGLPEIQCSIQVLCAAGCAGSILPKQKRCSLLLLPQLGSLFPLLSKPPLGNMPPFWPHSPGVQVSAAGAGAVQEHAGAAGCRQLSGWVFFGRGTRKSTAQANYNMT